jgi:hypothetical protein
LNQKIISTFILLIGFHCCIGQELIKNDKKSLKYNIILGIARSTFEVHQVPESPKYPSLELRLGVGLIKPLGNIFEIKTGLYFGLKVKRESYFYGPTNQFTKERYVIPSLDETASARNHLVTDIPLMLQVNIPKSRLSLRTGLNARLWQPHNDADGDDLASRDEFGIISGLTHKFSSKINLGIDLYLGLTNIYFGGLVNSSPNPTQLKVTNQYAQFTMEYSFNRKSKKTVS